MGSWWWLSKPYTQAALLAEFEQLSLPRASMSCERFTRLQARLLRRWAIPGWRDKSADIRVQGEDCIRTPASSKPHCGAYPAECFPFRVQTTGALSALGAA